MKLSKILILFVTILLVGPPSFSWEMSGQFVIKKGEELMRGEEGILRKDEDQSDGVILDRPGHGLLHSVKIWNEIENDRPILTILFQDEEENSWLIFTGSLVRGLNGKVYQGDLFQNSIVISENPNYESSKELGSEKVSNKIWGSWEKWKKDKKLIYKGKFEFQDLGDESF